MGMPSVNIRFTEKAVTVAKRGERGIVAMILKDTLSIGNPFMVLSISDIPNGLKEENAEQIKLALLGYVNMPKRLLCYLIPEPVESQEVDYTEALEYFATARFDYLVIPTVETDEKTDEVALWIKNCRETLEKKVKAVLPNSKSDYEGIVNYTTREVKTGDKTYTTEEYCARIAGLIAGTPLTISCTYAPLNELDGCTRMIKTDMDKAVDDGELIVYWDGEKVKVARGVNSFITTTPLKGNSFEKIKVVEALDMIFDDIKKTAEDSYLGKYANSYDNKCLLIGAINGYLEQLIMDGILNPDMDNKVRIDLEAQRIYLKGKGVKVEELSDDEIKTYDTDDKVFLCGTIKVLDAIEEIYIPISI